ncbi:xanthine phosphoribosyltransferase [Fundicoccus culcitae]|uniref:Xanthine phosphoribosyltransferase n=1 Tax=Fundicoccus culcitae TaxID=2969821 RepID=A0ABY5P4L4_9LACT|nr:xanthine phosphoribosyltransferase [Fundicoccus culcitae]UUX33683.1 xanthine phosphoribosyltransferase [Fundicoccus culcitae]
MKLLEEKIQTSGKVIEPDILKVDSFINHMLDPELIMAMGEDFYQHFKDKPITKILTLEVSGIAIAFAAGHYFKVPVLFAKKIESLTLGDDVYSTQVISYTKQKEYTVKINRSFLTADDHVLIIDDFLAKGEALKGLLELCRQAGASVEGIGIAIEKVFQGGGDRHRQQGYDVYSQAMIERFENGRVVFSPPQ